MGGNADVPREWHNNHHAQLHQGLIRDIAWPTSRFVQAIGVVRPVRIAAAATPAPGTVRHPSKIYGASLNAEK